MTAPSRIRPVSAALWQAMRTHGTRPASGGVARGQLCVVEFSHLDFDGRLRTDGQIMVMTAVGCAVQAIFAALLARGFPIARAKLIDYYHGDDDASMRDNNTSGFNHRLIRSGGKQSLHAYGLAIDINPVQNPYLEHDLQGRLVCHPAAGAVHIDRNGDQATRRGYAEQVADVFAMHGFTVWGGDWQQPVDYQHFQVERALAEKLAQLPNEPARRLFEQSLG